MKPKGVEIFNGAIYLKVVKFNCDTTNIFLQSEQLVIAINYRFIPNSQEKTFLIFLELILTLGAQFRLL